MKKIILMIIFSVILLACDKENEKNITVYTAVEEHLVGEYIKKFNEEYPDIKVNVISGGTGDIIAKLIAEKDNPQADIVWSTSDIMLLKKDNLLEKYTPENSKEIPNIFKDKEENYYWTGNSIWLVALGLNEVEAKKLNLNLISSYKDLFNEKLKGQVVMANPNSSGTGYLTINTIFNIYGEEKGWEYLDKLHQNIGEYTASGNSPVQIVGRGEKIIGFIPAYQGIYMEQEGKLPLKVIFPEEGLGWELEATALIKKQKIKPEAKTFIEWTLSDNGMKIQAKNRGFVTNPKMREIFGYPENVDQYLKERNFEKELENRDRILKEWERRYGKGE